MPTNVQLAQLVEELAARLTLVQSSVSRLKDELYEAKENTTKLEKRMRRVEEVSSQLKKAR